MGLTEAMALTLREVERLSGAYSRRPVTCAKLMKLGLVSRIATFRGIKYQITDAGRAILKEMGE